VKPKKENFKELNVDFSCLDLPVQEGGPVRGRHKFVERNRGRQKGWGKVIRSQCSNSDASEARLTEQDLDAGRTASREMNTTFEEQRKAPIELGRPEEVSRGDHRSSPDNPITGFSLHPTEVTGQEHVIGDISYLSEAHKVELRGGAATLDYRDSMDENGTREVRKAIEEEYAMNLEKSEIEGCASREQRAHCASWEPVPESGNIPGVFVAKPTIGNALKAMKGRHFKIASGVGEMTKVGKRHIQRVCSMLKQVLMQERVESGALALAFDILSTLPSEFKSGKWTEERFLTALRTAGVDCPRELPCKAHVKPNEALSKEKPRRIITSGDAGVVRHIFDAGLLEHALFHNPRFEQRSLKHATRREFGRRMGEILRNYDFVASMDFGAFDGSCTKECRDLIENDIILSMFMKMMDLEGPDSLLAAAIFDRIKNKCSISVKNVVKAVIFDMIRESGDRGTSILNYLTNICIFFANLSLMLERKGYSEKVVRKIVMDALKDGKLANLMGEGDDGLQAFAETLIRMVGTKFEFGEAWCAGYTEFGFKIEPQGPEGDLSFGDCIVSSAERAEFCSKIAVMCGMETYFYPKPGKLSNSLTVSFDITNGRHDAGYTKAVAMMSNCVHQPLLFKLCHTLASHHAAHGGKIDVAHMKVLLGPDQGEAGDDFADRLKVEHDAFLMDGKAPAIMMRSFERETGMKVADQENAIIALDTGCLETVTAHYPRLMNMERDMDRDLLRSQRWLFCLSSLVVGYVIEEFRAPGGLEPGNPLVEGCLKPDLDEVVSFVQKRPRQEGTRDAPSGQRRRRTYISLVSIAERWWELGDAGTRAKALRALMARIRSQHGRAPLGFVERMLAPICTDQGQCGYRHVGGEHGRGSDQYMALHGRRPKEDKGAVQVKVSLEIAEILAYRGDHVRRVPPPPGEEPQNIDFTVFPAPPIFGATSWGQARGERNRLHRCDEEAIMTLGLITAIRAMLTELGQICHGASLVEVQLEQEEEEGDGTLMVQSRLVHWRATKSGPNENEQLPVEQEVMFLMQGAWVRSFGLVQRLQDDLEKAQPGVARLRAVHLQGRLLRNRGQFLTAAGQDLVSQVEAVCVALAGSAENEVATGFAAQPQEVQDPSVIEELAREEAAEQRDRAALEKQQADFEREQQEYDERMAAFAEEMSERAKSEACRTWDDWALWDEMHGPRRGRKRPYLEVSGEGARVVGQSLRFSTGASSSSARMVIRFGMESSSEAETVPIPSPEVVPPAGTKASSAQIPLDFQAFQQVFDQWRANKLTGEEVKARFGEDTLELLEAQLWGMQDSAPVGPVGSPDATGLADTLLDAIVEGASATSSVSQSMREGRQLGVAEEVSDKGLDAEDGRNCAKGPHGEPVGVHDARVVELEEGLSGVSQGDVHNLHTELDGEGLAPEDTDEEEQEWREMLGARSAGDVNLKARRRDRSD
ncbi:unnamed protein product, partial [Symbiodinium sp. KB8]